MRYEGVRHTLRCARIRQCYAHLLAQGLMSFTLFCFLQLGLSPLCLFAIVAKLGLRPLCLFAIVAMAEGAMARRACLGPAVAETAAGADVRPTRRWRAFGPAVGRDRSRSPESREREDAEEHAFTETAAAVVAAVTEGLTASLDGPHRDLLAGVLASVHAWSVAQSIPYQVAPARGHDASCNADLMHRIWIWPKLRRDTLPWAHVDRGLVDASGAWVASADEMWDAMCYKVLPGMAELDSIFDLGKAGFRQIVWVWCDEGDMPLVEQALLCAHPDMSKFRIALKNLKGMDMLRNMPYLLEQNTPVQHVKDIISFFIVFLFGGSFGDLKLFWKQQRRISLGGHEEVMFASEPARKNALTSHGTTFTFDHFPSVEDPTAHKALGMIWLGYFMGVSGSQALYEAFDRCHRFWLNRSRSVQLGQESVVDWKAQFAKPWMQNVRILTEIATSTAFAPSVRILPPKTVCPLPAWLYASDRIGSSARNYGYYVPTNVEVEADTTCVALTLWKKRNEFHQQWTQLRRHELLEYYHPDFFASDDDDDDDDHHGAFGASALAARMHSARMHFKMRVAFFLEGVWLRELVVLYGHSRAFSTIGSAFSILERHGGVLKWLDRRSHGDDKEARAFAFVLALFAFQWESVARKVGYKPHLLGPLGGEQHAQGSCKILFDVLVSAWAGIELTGAVHRSNEAPASASAAASASPT